MGTGAGRGACGDAHGKDPVDMRKGEAGRILTIMRNDIEGWHEIGKARLNGYGRAGICFERDQVSPKDKKSTEGDAIGDTLSGFSEVDDDEVMPF